MKQGSISFTGNNSNGGPGAAGARNGLSTNSGFVVLGQNVGEAGNPAILTSIREIPYNTFAVIYQSPTTNNIEIGNTSILPVRTSILIRGNTASLPCIGLTNTNALVNPLWRFEASSADEFQLYDSTGLFFRMNRTLASISAPMNMWKVVQDNNANVIFTGIIPRSRTVMTNRGAGANVTFTIAGAFIGYEYTFIVVAGFSIIIQAPGGITLRNGALVTAPGGTLTGAAVGSSIRLILISATEWVAIAVIGAWV